MKLTDLKALAVTFLLFYRRSIQWNSFVASLFFRRMVEDDIQAPFLISPPLLFFFRRGIYSKIAVYASLRL